MNSTILPEVADDAATIHGWSDNKAATIVARTAKTITVREDNARLLNGVDSGEEDALTFSPGGFSGHTSGRQRYEYTTAEDGFVQKYSLRKSGRWVAQGQPDSHYSRTLTIGKRSHHYDFNF